VIDHVAIRTGSSTAYEKELQSMSDAGCRIIREICIRGRRVCILRLPQPIVQQGFSIPFLEILEPADGDSGYLRTVEHIEVIIDDEPIEVFCRRYPQAKFVIKKQQYDIEAKLRFADGANVKFHTLPIDEKIAREEAAKASGG
jgi:predicted metalloenzyme YecM